MRIKLLIIPALLLAAINMHAQDGKVGEAFSFLRGDRSPVSSAMAGAGFTLIDNSAFAAFGNPAVSALMDGRVSAGLSYRYWGPEILNENQIAASFSIKAMERLGVTAGYYRGIQPPMDGETFRANDNNFSIGAAYSITDNISVGLNGHYAMQQLMEDYRLSSFAVDAAVQYHADNYNGALAIMGLGPKVVSQYSGAYPLPASVKLAGDYTLDAEAFKVLFAADADYYFSGNYGISAGASFLIADIVYLRAGGRYASPTCVVPTHIAAGAGVNLGMVSLNLSYLTANSTIGNSFMAGLSLSL